MIEKFNFSRTSGKIHRKKAHDVEVSGRMDIGNMTAIEGATNAGATVSYIIVKSLINKNLLIFRDDRFRNYRVFATEAPYMYWDL